MVLLHTAFLIASFFIQILNTKVNSYSANSGHIIIGMIICVIDFRVYILGVYHFPVLGFLVLLEKLTPVVLSFFSSLYFPVLMVAYHFLRL